MQQNLIHAQVSRRCINLGRSLVLDERMTADLRSSAELADAGVGAWHRCVARSWSVPGVTRAGLGCLQAADEGVEAGGEPFVAVV